LRAGVIASAVATFSGNLKKGVKPPRPSDFFVSLGGDAPVPVSVEHVIGEVFSGVKIVRAADRAAVRRAAARPPKREKR
jgi:hypothetical protein